MPYLASGQSLKKYQKKRMLYQKLVLLLEDLHNFIMKNLEGLQGESTTRHLRHQRELFANYQWTDPLDSFQVEIIIHQGLDRLKSQMISGFYGLCYDYSFLPRREGSFEYSLTWGEGYLQHFDPYYYYSYDYGYYGGYFQSWDIDKVMLELNACLDSRDIERFNMTVYDDKIHEALDKFGIIANVRIAYINYAVEVFRIRTLLDKSEWQNRIDEEKGEGINAQLDHELLLILDSIIVPEIC